jgi:hypothetical protein
LTVAEARRSRTPPRGANQSPRALSNRQGKPGLFRYLGDAMARLCNASFALVLGLLAACGGGGSADPPQAHLARVLVASQSVGPTPFIAHVDIGLARPDLVSSVFYTIVPKPGTVSKPVAVTYSASYLARRGLLDRQGERLVLPVFGLYADFVNAVVFTVSFMDGSARTDSVTIATPAYQEAVPRYTALDVKLPRQPDQALGYDFILLKNKVTTPVVIDTDGNVRWIGTGVSNGLSSTFSDGRFLVGSGTRPELSRVELDGSVSTVRLSDPTYADFHHDMEPGKFGVLAEIDAVAGGVLRTGTILAEIDAEGHVLKQWDMSAIFRATMLAASDDPSGLVRDEADWFHMNSAIYSPADDTLLVSSRENFVVKLDYASGRIRWLLGDTTKYWYTYPSLRALALTLTTGKPPIGQHGLTIAPDGDLLLFNNGTASFNQPPGTSAGLNPGFSAPSKYAIDETARTASEVWTYEHGRDIWADVCSSVYQSGQGGILIDYASAYGRTRAKLIGLDAQGKLAFDYEFPNQRCDTAFNAAPIDFANLTLR